MKRKIVWSVSICAVAGLLLLFAGHKIQTAQTSGIPQSHRPTVILDAGHGGMDGGAVSVTNTLEKDINLDITLRLRDLLTAYAFPVVMVRETDVSIHDSSAVSIREIKRSDLHNRLALTKKYDNCILLSIHQNFFTESKYSGAQFFYSINHPESKRLAQYFKDYFRAHLQPENSREIKPSGNNIYLMRYTQIPAVLAECGFLSNPLEAELLDSEEYRQKIAVSLLCGILNYYRDT